MKLKGRHRKMPQFLIFDLRLPHTFLRKAMAGFLVRTTASQCETKDFFVMVTFGHFRVQKCFISLQEQTNPSTFPQERLEIGHG